MPITELLGWRSTWECAIQVLDIEGSPNHLCPPDTSIESRQGKWPQALDVQRNPSRTYSITDDFSYVIAYSVT